MRYVILNVLNTEFTVLYTKIFTNFNNMYKTQPHRGCRMG